MGGSKANKENRKAVQGSREKHEIEIIVPELEGIKIKPRSKDWSDIEEAQLERYYERGISIIDIAKAMDRTYYSIADKAKSMGLKRKK